jgi:hypothetical protein
MTLGSRLLKAAAALATLLLCSGGCKITQPTHDSVLANGGREREIAWALLEGLAITAAPLPNDARSALIALKTGNATCWSRTLTPSDGAFTLETDCGRSEVALDLQFVSPDGRCQNGGLYLIKGRVVEAGSQTRVYQNIILARWNSVGLSVPADITPAPHDSPRLVSQSGTGEWALGAPVSELGRWTYTAHFEMLPDPMPKCSAAANVWLTLQPPAQGASPRTFAYRVTHKNVGGALVSSVTSSNPDAPEPVLAVGSSGRPSLVQMNWVGIQAMRGASASLRVAYEMPVQVPEPPVAEFSAPLVPYLKLSGEIPLSDSSTPKPLAAHLGAFFDALTAPVARSSTLRLKLAASLSYSLLPTEPDEAPHDIELPVLLFPSFPFAVGVDERSDCSAQTKKSFVCTLDENLAERRREVFSTSGAARSPSYRFRVSIYGTKSETPVIHLTDVTLPLALVSP